MISSQSVVILAPSENDSFIASRVLQEAGFETETVETLTDLCNQLEKSVGALVIADEALKGDDVERLQRLLERQASWSDLPVILMTSASNTMASHLFSSSGNISILERPFSRTTLVRSVDVALRARKKQYQVRDLLTEQIQAGQARDEFFATLSHELRTPLSVILGWLDVLRNNSKNPVVYSNALDVFERNVQMQKKLIDDLLDISRIITGKMHFELAVLDLGALLRSIFNSFQPQAFDKRLSFHLNLEEKTFPVFGDEQRLSQALTNLISNAFKFTPTGGQINVSLGSKDESLFLSIEDSGSGIDPAFLPFIFDRLKQEDMTSTRLHGGMGLGLAIASHIVEAHHGQISAVSDGRGKGTTLKVSLPRSHVESFKSPSTNIITDVRSLRGKKILAVDDCLDILDLLQFVLSETEAEVHSVESANQALSELDTFKPDVILSDIGMPNMDGYQLIQAIRARPAEKGGQTPAIALTAYARDEERVRALRAGFQMHISKPISNTELISAIASLSRN